MSDKANVGYAGGMSGAGAGQEYRNPRNVSMEPGVGQAVIESREEAHGNYVDQAGLAQFLKLHLRAKPGWEKLGLAQRESLEMICVKMSRILNGNANDPDHWTDIAGYATLISNLLTKGRHL